MQPIADINIGKTNNYISEVQQTFRFMNDENNVETRRLAAPTPISLMGNEDRVHSITDFLERPIKLDTAIMSSTDTGYPTIMSVDLTRLLDNANNSNKLFGFRYFRADVEFSLYVNSQPFQAGALIMYYIPYSAHSNSWSQTETMTGVTGFLSTVLNLEDKAPAKIYIPFNHPHGFLDMVDIAGDLGTLKVGVYEPILSAEPTDAEVTLFGRFANVKLIGPTSETLDNTILTHTAQSYDPKGAEDFDFIDSLNCNTAHSKTTVDFNCNECCTPFIILLKRIPQTYFKKLRKKCFKYVAQSREQDSESAQQAKSGVVTQISKAVNKVANSLSGIPALEPFALPVSWVSSAVHSVASFFGWSKPTNVTTTVTSKIVSARNMSNFNGTDMSHMLSLDCDNQILPYQFFGDSDQLAFDNIVSRLNRIELFYWHTAAPAGHELATPVDVTPTVGMKFSPVNGDSDGVHYAKFVSFLAFTASHFRLWHGDITFQLRSIKTPFHSGRMLIRWTPGVTHGNTISDVPMAYSIVWDITTNNTISFTVPYMNPRPWLKTKYSINEISSVSNNSNTNGILQFFVLNKLVAANAAVADQISIIVEVCGAKGFSFAHPIDSRLVPVHKNSVPVDPELAPAYVAQIGEPVNNIDLVPSGMKHEGLHPEQLSTGEKIVSFRQLLKRFTYYRLYGTSNNFGNIRNAHHYELFEHDVLHLDPYNTEYPLKQKTINTQVNDIDLLSTIGSIFAYKRGGVRLKILPRRKAVSVEERHPTYITSQLYYEGGGDIENAKVAGHTSTYNNNSAIAISRIDLEGVSEIQVPYYSTTAYVHTHDNFDNTNYYVRSIVRRNYTSRGDFDIWRAAADDFDFIFPVGVPSFIVKPFGKPDAT